MFETIDIEYWKFINTFAPWFSAFGTVTAVMVSLYLAKSEKPVKLKILADIRILTEENNPRYLMIEAINIGSRIVNITNIGWEMGLFKKLSFIQVVKKDINDFYSSELPIKINDGEEAKWLILLEKEKNWIEQFVKNLGKFPRWDLFWLRLQIVTANGKIFKAKIGKSLKDELLKEYSKQHHKDKKS